jgi:hypothetical protein
MRKYNDDTQFYQNDLVSFDETNHVTENGKELSGKELSHPKGRRGRAGGPGSPAKFDTFIMMDMDDVCSTPINVENLQKYLTRDDWDALSFNRGDYYDIWALSIPPYNYSCWHVPNGYAAVDKIKAYITKILDECDDNDLVECLSAFNGFAIYRMEAFQNVFYEWNINKNPMPKSWLIDYAKAIGQHIMRRPNDDDCEHRYFHMQAIRENGARIRISPLSLFRENQHFPFDPATI